MSYIMAPKRQLLLWVAEISSGIEFSRTLFCQFRPGLNFRCTGIRRKQHVVKRQWLHFNSYFIGLWNICVHNSHINLFSIEYRIRTLYNDWIFKYLLCENLENIVRKWNPFFNLAFLLDLDYCNLLNRHIL